MCTVSCMSLLRTLWAALVRLASSTSEATMCHPHRRAPSSPYTHDAPHPAGTTDKMWARCLWHYTTGTVGAMPLTLCSRHNRHVGAVPVILRSRHNRQMWARCLWDWEAGTKHVGAVPVTLRSRHKTCGRGACDIVQQAQQIKYIS